MRRGLLGPSAFAALLCSLALAWLPAPAVLAGTGAEDGPAKGTGTNRVADLRAETADEEARKKEQAEAGRVAARKAAAEAAERAFLAEAKAGKAKRLELGGGVHLDLIKVGGGVDACYLGRYEVTQEQYSLVTGRNPSCYEGADRAGHPVERVSWHDAMAFCKQLNAALGKEMGGYVFSLPTEAQWEKAAYAGARTAYSGGDDLGEVGWWDGNSGGSTHVVGTKKPNARGFHDMSGNVCEWCLDADGSLRASRGGGWFSNVGFCRVDYRFSYFPGSRVSYFGFRVAASLR